MIAVPIFHFGTVAGLIPSLEDIGFKVAVQKQEQRKETKAAGAELASQALSAHYNDTIKIRQHELKEIEIQSCPKQYTCLFISSVSTLQKENGNVVRNEDGYPFYNRYGSFVVAIPQKGTGMTLYKAETFGAGDSDFIAWSKDAQAEIPFWITLIK